MGCFLDLDRPVADICHLHRHSSPLSHRGTAQDWWLAEDVDDPTIAGYIPVNHVGPVSCSENVAAHLVGVHTNED